MHTYCSRKWFKKYTCLGCCTFAIVKLLLKPLLWPIDYIIFSQRAHPHQTRCDLQLPSCHHLPAIASSFGPGRLSTKGMEKGRLELDRLRAPPPPSRQTGGQQNLGASMAPSTQQAWKPPPVNRRPPNFPNNSDTAVTTTDSDDSDDALLIKPKTVKKPVIEHKDRHSAAALEKRSSSIASLHFKKKSQNPDTIQNKPVATPKPASRKPSAAVVLDLSDDSTPRGKRVASMDSSAKAGSSKAKNMARSSSNTKLSQSHRPRKNHLQVSSESGADSEEEMPLPKSKKRARPPPRAVHKSSLFDSPPRTKAKVKVAAMPFPMDSPKSSQGSTTVDGKSHLPSRFPAPSPIRGNARKGKSKAPEAFPMSPPKSSHDGASDDGPRRGPQGFPELSPIRHEGKRKGKGKDISMSGQEVSSTPSRRKKRHSDLDDDRKTKRRKDYMYGSLLLFPLL